MKQSLTETSPRPGASSCCSTGSGRRDAKTSPGTSSTGSRLTVASAAPVTMFVAPGPIELVQTSAPSRLQLPRVADGGVHHRLLVPRLAVGEEVGPLVERLPDPGDVAVPEDAEAAAEEALPHAVALDLLDGEEPHERLGGGQPHALTL